ncbi:unnamed protein product, partial [Anisakis simplex]|uniref:DUF4476 domain-containing protein n=1 Tax=Anisakis simplex TaxID=6269 RepID=A0A0M3KC57_ANISI
MTLFWQLWLLLLLLLSVAKQCSTQEDAHARQRRSNIPCGTSFTPCSNGPLDFDDNNGIIDEDGEEALIANSQIPRLKNSDEELEEIVSRKNLLTAIKDARSDMNELFNRTERSLFIVSNDQTLSQAEINWSEMYRIDRYAKDLSYSALTSIKTTQQLQRLGLSPAQIVFGLPAMELEKTALSEI